MTVINPVGAAQRLLNLKTGTRGFCLHYVSAVILNGLPVLENAEDCTQSWANTPEQYRHTSWPPPHDYPVYLTGADGQGDVNLGWAGDELAALDANEHYGTFGLQTLESREQQVAGKYLGWANWISGYTLTLPPVPPTPPIKKRKYPMFGFVSNPAGEISIVNPATGTRRALSPAEWSAYNSQGITAHAALSQVDYESIPLA